MKYGYCRISKPKQVIARQIRNIKAACPDAIIIQEVFTRTRMDRKEWQRLMRIIKPSFNWIIFDSVSRMSGNEEERSAEYERLYNMGVIMVFLKEPHINTATYKKALENNIALTGSNVDYIPERVNKYLMTLAKDQIKLAFKQAEKRVEDLHQRTKEGLVTAKLAGTQISRKAVSRFQIKKSLEKKNIMITHSKDFNGNLNDADVILLTCLSRNTYYKYKHEIKNTLL